MATFTPPQMSRSQAQQVLRLSQGVTDQDWYDQLNQIHGTNITQADVNRVGSVQDAINEQKIGFVPGTDAERRRLGGVTSRDTDRERRALTDAAQDRKDDLIDIANSFEISRDDTVRTANAVISGNFSGLNPNLRRIAQGPRTAGRLASQQPTGGTNVALSATQIQTLQSAGFSPNQIARLAADPNADVGPAANPPGGGGQAQQGARPNADSVLRDIASGRLNRDQGVRALEAIGWTPQGAATIVDDIRSGNNRQYPFTGTATGTGTNLAATTDTRVPTAVPTPTSRQTAPPVNFTDLMEQIGAGDVARQFALESGVAPSFRGLVQNRAAQQLLPFALQQATSPGFDPETSLTTRGFQDFIRNRGVGGFDLGNTLRQAANFLRNPALGGDVFSPGQEAIRGRLLNEGAIGSELFSPLVSMVASGRTGRTIPGFDVSGAVRTSLNNLLAQDPLRFQTAPEFIDFLSRQRII